MKKAAATKKSPSPQKQEGITQITVAGYKSISQEQSIEIRPLTILAGANSSGKSSIMQPLLLLKQTLEASYDPGALLLNGPNVRCTSADQVLSRTGRAFLSKIFSIGIGVGFDQNLTLYFEKDPKRGFDIQQMKFIGGGKESVSPIRISKGELPSKMAPAIRDFLQNLPISGNIGRRWTIGRNRCFLEFSIVIEDEKQTRIYVQSASTKVEPYIRESIHIPPLRGNPERTYPVTAVGSSFPGTFEKYAASVIAQWQVDKDHEKLDKLNKDLQQLGLTWKITSKSIDDTQVELQVGLLPRAIKGGARGDLINIADVGFGVSQTLPVLVALHVARPGQLVYIEQPESQLHPRAQVTMAQVLAEAASRGVRVVAETHSSLLLLGVQSLVAEGKLSPDIAKLHWFSRGDDGVTEIESADLDEAGAFGDWPEDFSDVDFAIQRRYLDAAEQRRWKR